MDIYGVKSSQRHLLAPNDNKRLGTPIEDFLECERMRWKFYNFEKTKEGNKSWFEKLVSNLDKMND